MYGWSIFDKILRSVIICSTFSFCMIKDLLITFIAYSIPVLFNLTSNTLEKPPLPINLMISKSLKRGIRVESVESTFYLKGFT